MGATVPLHLLDQLTYAGMYYTMQTNGIPDEAIRLSASGNHIACPV
jgi:hypothetical protein